MAMKTVMMSVAGIAIMIIMIGRIAATGAGAMITNTAIGMHDTMNVGTGIVTDNRIARL